MENFKHLDQVDSEVGLQESFPGGEVQFSEY